MDKITQSAEHHLLANIEGYDAEKQNWSALFLNINNGARPENLLSDFSILKNHIQKTQARSLRLLEQIGSDLAKSYDGYVYKFADGDLCALCKGSANESRNRLNAYFESLCARENLPHSRMMNLEHDLYSLQKLADFKFLTARRAQAYSMILDEHMRASIPLRRRKRKSNTVLVVEDDRFSATYAERVLGERYEVLHAKNGEDAIIAYIENSPDAVLMDLHLPGLNGHQTMAAIRKADPQSYIVMLSSDTVRKNIVEASSKGAVSFLKKPFTKDRLLNIMRKSPHINAASSAAMKKETAHGEGVITT